MTKVEDNKAFGPKSKDSKRVDDEKDVARPELSAEERASRTSAEVNAQCTDESIEGANQHLHDVTSGHVFGDNTSSAGGANNPGQHGRDGGTVNGEDNNPAPEDPTPEEEAPPPEADEAAADESGTQTNLGIKKDDKAEIKKL